MASTTEQVWSGVGTDESDNSISGELQQNGFGSIVDSKQLPRNEQD